MPRLYRATRKCYNIGPAKASSTYIGGCILRNFIEPVLFGVAWFIFALHKKKYHIGRIFRYT